MLIDTRSPERAWEPFMEWMRSQGIKPEDCRAVEIDETAMTAEVTVFKRSIGGKRTGDVKKRTVRISSLPPLHASRT